MDRRDALKSFLALPATAVLERHEVRKGDIAILELKGSHSQESIERMQKSWKDTLPEIPLIITGPDSKLSFSKLNEEVS